MQRDNNGQNAKKAQWIYVKPTNAANVRVKAYLYKEGSAKHSGEIRLKPASTGDLVFQACLEKGRSRSRSWSRQWSRSLQFILSLQSKEFMKMLCIYIYIYIYTHIHTYQWLCLSTCIFCILSMHGMLVCICVVFVCICIVYAYARFASISVIQVS